MKKSKRSTGGSRSAGKPGLKGKRKAGAGGDGQETLEGLLDRLGIGDDWDFLIVGDGSGSNWNREAGWAAVSVERVTMERLVWYGAMNRGTVNFAEVMAYLQPLNWLAAREADRRGKGRQRSRACRVHIVTDSEYASNTGGSANRMVAKNGALWAAFDVFARQGFVLNWHWVRRDDCALNTYCDELSKLARRLAKTYNLQERVGADVREDGSPTTVYDVNPSSAG